MGNPSVQPSCILTFLLSLASAIPNPFPSQATTLLGNRLSDNLPNATTLLGNRLSDNLPNATLAAVIPSDFTIQPSLPLDEPVLDRRWTLFLTLRVLGGLALEDFIGEQQSQSWRATQGVSIDVIGPGKVVGSAVPLRKYAVWGIYKVIHLMVASNDFRPRNYGLFSRGTVVGYVSFNTGPPSALKIGEKSANETDIAVQNLDLSTSTALTTKDSTTVGATDNAIDLVINLQGLTIGETNVFMTVFTAIVKAAPYYQTERVTEFVLNTRTFNTLITCKGKEDTAPGEPVLEYNHLVQMFTLMPPRMSDYGGRWTEADMVVLSGSKVLGAGVLRWVSRGSDATLMRS